MRQLTASQKIAILENRVAQLEKQAMFTFIQDKLESLVSGLRPVKVASKALRSSGIRQKDIEKGLKNTPKTEEFEQLQKEIRGKSDEQKIYILSEILESGEPRGRRAVSLGKIDSIFPSSERIWAKFLIQVSIALTTLLTVFLIEKSEALLKKLKVKIKKEEGGRKYFFKFLKAVLTFLYYPIKGIRIIGSVIINAINFIPHLILEKSTGIKIPRIDPFGK